VHAMFNNETPGQGPAGESGLPLVRLTGASDLEAVCEHDMALIYKHSPRCGVSLAAVSEIRRFMEAEPTVPVYVVDVIRDRLVSRAVAERFGISHESPQAILLQDGAPVWNGSHRAVTAAALAREIVARRPGGPPPE
jgi:bacillithiol system protein YtxJ